MAKMPNRVAVALVLIAPAAGFLALTITNNPYVAGISVMLPLLLVYYQHTLNRRD